MIERFYKYICTYTGATGFLISYTIFFIFFIIKQAVSFVIILWLLIKFDFITIGKGLSNLPM